MTLFEEYMDEDTSVERRLEIIEEMKLNSKRGLGYYSATPASPRQPYYQSY